MTAKPVTVTSTNGVSIPAERTLFRIALTVAMIGIVAVSTILILHSGLALHRLRYFLDVGLYSLRLTSAILLIFGLLSLSTFIILTIGLAKRNKTSSILAAVLLSMCTLGLITFSIWPFLTVRSGQLPASINSTIVEELDQTQYKAAAGNTIIVENTSKMAKLEKQHHCCGLTDPIEDYRRRQSATFKSLNPSSYIRSSYGRGRTPMRQNPTIFEGSVQLPISCCNESRRSDDNLCINMFGNKTNSINPYNTAGCYAVVTLYKFERIQQQGFTTVIAACLAVISCFALVAVIRLMGGGYQIISLHTAT